MTATPPDPPTNQPAPPTVRRVAELRQSVADWRRAGETVGLVPTMGALHGGHLALVQRARRDCSRVVATIFVNPAQFDEADDLAGYPRDEADDARKFAAEGVNLLFAPPLEEIYPPGFATKVSLPELAGCLCGIARPGHMDGVATVVAKLLNQAQPDIAYFGEKDYQQLQMIRRMAADLDIPVRIEGVATVREPDGLALSSRNVLLPPDARGRAPAMYRALAAAAKRLADGGQAAEPVLADARRAIAAAGFEPIDYLDLRAEDDLRELARAERPARVFAAAWLGTVRLIDNVAVPRAGAVMAPPGKGDK